MENKPVLVKDLSFDNVIFAVFAPQFYDELFMFIKYNGIARAEKWLLSQDYHPTFVKCAIKRIISTRGW